MSEALYQSIVLARARTPHHAGRPDAFDVERSSENRMCGDQVSIFLTRAGTQVRHEVQGCTILAASAELMCDAVTGKTPEEIAILSGKFETLVKTGTENPDLGELNALASLAQYPSRLRCATLPWGALTDAVSDAGAVRGDRDHG